MFSTTVGAGNKAGSGFETFTRNKVAELRSKGHVLIIIKGGVYDVTHFCSHPGKSLFLGRKDSDAQYFSLCFLCEI